MSDKDVTIAGVSVKKRDFSKLDKVVFNKTVSDFIDTASTATNRATAYNTAEEQSKAVEALHKNLITIDRGVYGASLLLPGVTDYSLSLGIENLLSKTERTESTIPFETETNMIIHMVSNLPVTRMLKLFMSMKDKKVNNSRTRKVMLGSILNSPSLDYWSVKYRTKLREILSHVWGKRSTSIIQSILTKKPEDWNVLEKEIIENNINKHYVGGKSLTYVYECISFILKNEAQVTLHTLKSFVESKTTLEKGNKLPTEVLEGIRSTYHKTGKTHQDVLKITAVNLTEKEKMTKQKSAKKQGVKIEWDPTKQEVVELYKYALENGMTREIKDALTAKALKSANDSPIAYENLGILVDASNSSIGDDTQKYRPLAVTLSLRDMLMQSADQAFVEYAGGIEKAGLVYPMGETNLAKPLIKLLKKNPDAIFIISDGYENAPAGRVNEIVGTMKNLGYEIPIYQISPVMSAEAGGLRKLSDKISALPASKPSALGLSMVKAMLLEDIDGGINGLFSLTLPRLKRKSKR